MIRPRATLPRPAARRPRLAFALLLVASAAPVDARVHASSADPLIDATTADGPDVADLVAVPRQGAVRVVIWNIQRGANHFTWGKEKALAVLRAIDADVCLLQESYPVLSKDAAGADVEGPKLGRWIADELGWNEWQGDSPHLCVLTRLPIEERFTHAPWHGVGARLRAPGGRELIVWSTWIDYREYLPYHLRDAPDATDEDLLDDERRRSQRLAQTEALLARLGELGHLDSELPVLVGGDWNCPSHLDWTADTARVFRFRRDLPLPVSRAVAAAGFVDVFRALHPDPVLRPGITWSPLYRGTAEVPETADRIDRLYRRPARGPDLVPVGATTLPLRHEAAVAEADQRFPSDHGAVVFDLDWKD